MHKTVSLISGLILVFVLALSVSAQAGGKISGKVVFGENAGPLGGASVKIIEVNRAMTTRDDGTYEFTNLPPGRYTVVAHVNGFADVGRTIVLAGGGSETVDLSLEIAGVKEQVTVTATGSKQSVFDVIQPTIVVGNDRLLKRGSVGLGDAVSNQPGVAMRTATPASSRPVIRGFDGDRVLLATDGIRDGSVSALSENEAEPIDLMSLDRIEVVRGPSTLLYGSNAFGGVVNAISRHDDDLQLGLRGYFTATGGTTNKQAAVSGGAEYGVGNWMVWGNGSGLRASDYNAGGNFGVVENTFARVANANFGGGYFAPKGFFTANYRYYWNHYGIPIDPADPDQRTATIAARHHDLRLNGGFRDLNSVIESIKFTFDYSKYTHRESEVFDQDPSTINFSEFHNRLFAYRGVFSQRRHGKLSGTFGFDGYNRRFFVVGEETLLKGTVNQNLFAGFVLEQVDLERVTFQFGARVENSRYRPTDASLINRDLTGFSGSAGMRVALWKNGAFVANYSHSTRLPDLEELYDNGPHDDTVSFEIGNQNLKKEASDGIDLSLRHQSGRFRADANFFHYSIKNFVFLMPTGVFDEDTELEIANYVQGDSRFTGFEGNIDFDAHRFVSLFGGIDYVRARLTSGVDLPRIPPLRGRLGVDAHYSSFDVRPELILVDAQDHLFTDETRTPGYAVFNITGSYTFMTKHVANVISVNAFNLTNKFYMNHVSFIKDFSPEIGRGVKFNYTLRFF